MNMSTASQFAPVPSELKQRDQWVCFRQTWVAKNERYCKKPFAPERGTAASTTDPATWSTFDEALRAYETCGHDGIGFVFAAGDPYCGIDLDECRDPQTGQIEPWAAEIIRRLNSYTEVSLSGTGVHVIVRAKLSGTRNRKGNIELYDHDRFFCVTGVHISDTSPTVEDRQGEVAEIRDEVFAEPERDQQTRVPGSGIAPKLSDEQVFTKAKQAINGEKFERLWQGDWSGYASQSQADQGLCNLLGWWTDDREQIHRLFRRSSLYRDKWERENYRDRTIDKALERRRQQMSSAAVGKSASYGDNQATRLIALASKAELFHDPDREAYATVPVNSHKETWPLRSDGFKSWLAQRFYAE